MHSHGTWIFMAAFGEATGIDAAERTEVADLRDADQVF